MSEAKAWQALAPGEIAVVHLSDPHFGSPGSVEVWDTVRVLLKDPVKPKLLLVTGDLAHSTNKAWYRVAAKALHDLGEDLGLKYYVCPGNHDRFVLGNRVNRALLLQDPWVAGGKRAAQLFISVLLVGWAVTLFAACTGWGWWLLGGLCLLLLAPLWGLDRWLARRFDTRDREALFDAEFRNHLLSHIDVTHEHLGPPETGWNLGLVALDSNKNTDFLARGQLDGAELEELFRAIASGQAGGEEREFDLCILLVHHHLLSIRELEAGRSGKTMDLLNATCLVNAGTALEALGKSRVDLVLHGHEHMHNWATYASLERGYGPVRVVAAGSATGNDSLAGCKPCNATLNVLILAPDRSLRLRRMRWQPGSPDKPAAAAPARSSWWRRLLSRVWPFGSRPAPAATEAALPAGDWWQAEEVLLFSSDDIRHARVRRRALVQATKEHYEHPERNEITSTVQKAFLCTRERNVDVYWRLTDWFLDMRQFVYPVANSTGHPLSPKVRVRLAAEEAWMDVRADLGEHPSRDDTWLLQWDVPEQFYLHSVEIEVQYRWEGGVLLTREELEMFQKEGGLGYWRNVGKEYATIWTPTPLAALELHLSLPPEYEPDHMQVHVTVSDNEERQFKEEAEVLQSQLRHLATGHYLLRIPHPHVLRDYTLAWDPVAAGVAEQRLLNVPFARKFQDGARGRPQALLEAFRSSLSARARQCFATLALYVPAGGAVLVCLDSLCAGAAASAPNSRKGRKVLLTAEHDPVVEAWWRGKTVKRRRPPEEEDAIRTGFLDGEILQLCVPLRLSLNDTNPPPWGIVRLAIHEKEGLEWFDKQADDIIMMELLPASAHLLSRALTGEGSS